MTTDTEPQTPSIPDILAALQRAADAPDATAEDKAALLALGAALKQPSPAPGKAPVKDDYEIAKADYAAKMNDLRALVHGPRPEDREPAPAPAKAPAADLSKLRGRELLELAHRPGGPPAAAKAPVDPMKLSGRALLDLAHASGQTAT